MIYGPIRAKDLFAFLDAGLKATPEMRLKTFTTWERMELIPMELVGALKPGIIVIVIFFFLAFLGRSGEGWTNALGHGLFSVLAMLTAILAGAVLSPLLLPWLPGRAFSVKGLSVGVLFAVILAACYPGGWITGRRSRNIGLASSHPCDLRLSRNEFHRELQLTLLFRGLRREMRWALPLEIAAGMIGLGLWFGSHFIA